jgi:hypothetical protein
MYTEVAKDAVDAKLFNTPVRLASTASLILMKQQAVSSAEAQKKSMPNNLPLKRTDICVAQFKH